ncbi:MAG: RloB family protein [Anaerolineales bacterium]
MPSKRFIPKNRRSGYRDAKLIIIASEGTNTEKRYFEDLAESYSAPNIHVEVVDRPNPDPETVIKALDDFRKQYSLRKGYDELWMVVDIDQWKEKMLSEVVAACEQKGYGCAISNPCFELWLLLHLKSLEEYDPESLRKFKEPRKVKEKRHPLKLELSKLLGGYNEGNPDTAKFLGNVAIAIERAKALDTQPEHRWTNDLGTRVYLIAGKIINRR